MFYVRRSGSDSILGAPAGGCQGRSADPSHSAADSAIAVCKHCKLYLFKLRMYLSRFQMYLAEIQNAFVQNANVHIE